MRLWNMHGTGKRPYQSIHNYKYKVNPENKYSIRTPNSAPKFTSFGVCALRIRRADAIVPSPKIVNDNTE